MKYADSIYSRSGKATAAAFGGINRRIKSGSSEFTDMENILFSEYPALASSAEPDTVIQSSFTIKKLLFPKYADVNVSEFSGIAFTPLIKKISITQADSVITIGYGYKLTLERALTASEAEHLEGKTHNRCIIDGTEYSFTVDSSSRDIIYIKVDSTFPITDMHVYFTENAGEFGYYSIYINGIEERSDIYSYTDAVDFNGAILTFPELKGWNYKTKTSYAAGERKINPVTYEGDVKFDNDGGSSYIFNSGLKFKVGDTLIISDCYDAPLNNTFFPESSFDYSNIESPVTITVTSINPTLGTEVSLINSVGETIHFKTEGTFHAKVMAYIPQFEYGAIMGNRLWSLSKNGESIFASGLGKPLEYIYGATNTNAWYCDVGTPGKFTGIGVYNNRLLAFKKDNVHVIYGNTPNDFTAARSYTTGCIDGRSIANAGGMLIWLYYDGFYAYTGGVPQNISIKLDTKYTECTAFADNARYYARCKKLDGTYEMLIYDTRYGLWTKLSDLNIFGGDYFDGDVYANNEQNVYKLFGGDYGDFYAESVPVTLDTFDNKSLVYFSVRADIDNGFINIYTSVNGGDWVSHKGISKSGKTKLPIRYSNGDTFRYRIEGHGKVYIKDIDINVNYNEFNR